MCMEDVCIGRETETQEIQYSVNTTPAEILKADPDRIAVVIGPPSAAAFAMGFTPSVTVSTGILIQNTGPPITFNIRDHGELVRRSIFGVSAAARTGAIWVTKLRRQC